MASDSTGESDVGGSASSSDADFVWRFRIDEKAQKPLLDHPLDELLRVQWEELLKLCVPMFRGSPVKIDGFATMRDTKKILPIFPDTVRDEKEIRPAGDS